MIDTERKEDLFLDTKLIKSENRLGKLRIIDELHPVLGGQPTHEADQPNDNNPFLDLACTMQFTIDKVNAVDKKADTKLAKAQNLKDVANVAIARDNLGLGTSATMNATSTLSDRTDQIATIKVVNDVNRAASTAQKTANTANDKANTAQTRADSAYSLANRKWDPQTTTGTGHLVRESKVKAHALASNGRYLNGASDPIKLTAGEFGLGIGSKFLNIENPSVALADSFVNFEVMENYNGSGNNLFVFFNGYRKPVSGMAVSNDGGESWSKIAVNYSTFNTTTDKSGFLRASGSANALVESDVTNSLGNSKSLVASQALVNSLAQKIDDVPVDKIFAFDSATPPKGYIARNGQAIDKNTMPKLYARYGANMPDDRDRVHRMAGSLAGIAGSTQEDEIKSHNHEYILWGSLAMAGSNQSIVNYGQGNVKQYKTSSEGGKETRVKSRIVIFCNKIQ